MIGKMSENGTLFITDLPNHPTAAVAAAVDAVGATATVKRALDNNKYVLFLVFFIHIYHWSKVIYS